MLQVSKEISLKWIFHLFYFVNFFKNLLLMISSNFQNKENECMPTHCFESVQRHTRLHVGMSSSQNQEPSQFMNIFFYDFQHCSVLYPFLIVKILVHIEKSDVDNAFQIVRDPVSRQNVIDPFVLVNIEHDPTFPPLSFQRVHFELEINEL